MVLHRNERCLWQVPKAFRVSKAVLQTGTLSRRDCVVEVWLRKDHTDHLIANVSHQETQVNLDLVFSEGETVDFYIKRGATVHLSGFLIPEESDKDILSAK